MWGPCLVERLFEMSKWSTQHNGIVVPKSGGSESDNNQGTLVEFQSFIYRKVASSNMSRLEAHAGFFRLLMKGIFDPYVL